MHAIIESSYGKDDTEVDTRFKRKLDRLKEYVARPIGMPHIEMIIFHSDLEEILSILQDLSSADRVTRVAKHVESSQQITKCKDILDAAFQLFQVRVFPIFLVIH